MKRVLLFIVAGLLLLLLVVAAAAAWLLGTTEGARFALVRLSALAGMEVGIRQVQGRLWDRLSLMGVSATLPQQKAEVTSLELSWDPLELLHHRLHIRSLILSGVRLQDNTPVTNKPPTLAWPQATGFARQLRVQIDDLRVTTLSYRHLDQAPILVTSLATPVTWDGSFLRYPDFKARLPAGRIHGDITAGFVRPSLRLDLVLVPVRRIGPADLFSLQTRFLPAASPEQLAGSFALAGRGGGKQRLELTGELGMTRSAFNLRRLRLTMPGRRGTLGGAGTISFPTSAPFFSFDFQGKDLDLAPELKLPTRISGTVSFTGTLDDYRGRLRIVNSEKGWQGGTLEARYRGGANSISLSPLSGRLLDGSIAGSLAVDWSRGLGVTGNLKGRGLNPARLSPDWKGVVNLDLALRMLVPSRGPATGTLKAGLLQSTLHGQSLNGSADVAFSGENITVNRLFLAGKGFDLRAAGRVDRRVNLTARVTDLSRLVPGAAGALGADGWVRWHERRFSGELAAKGNGIAVDGMRAAALSLSARIAPLPGYPLHLDASLAGVRAGSFEADTATLVADGTMAHHELAAALTSRQGEARLALSGGYADGAWRGTITSFSGHDPTGPWRLAAPASLLLTRERLALSPLLLEGTGPERLEISADLDLAARTGSVRGDWVSLNLSRANAYLAGTAVSGTGSGSFDLRLLSSGRLAVTARSTAQGALVSQGHRVEVPALEATFDGGPSGVRSAFSLRVLGGEGNLVFTSRAPLRPALPEDGTIAGSWSGLDLAALAPFLPAGFATEGKLSGELRGDLRPGKRLEVNGNSFVTGGVLHYRDGDRLDLPLDVARLFFGWRGKVGTPGELSLSARLAGHGEVVSRGNRVELTAVEADFQGGARGMRGTATLRALGGEAYAELSSPSPLSLSLPARVDLSGRWSGVDLALLTPFLERGVEAQGVSSGELKGMLLSGGRVTVSGNSSIRGGRIRYSGKGDTLDAPLDAARLSFGWQGKMSEVKRGRLSASLRVESHPVFVSRGRRIEAERALVSLDAGEQGIRGEAELVLPGNGRVYAVLTGAGPASFSLPETGEVSASWEGIDPVLFRPWLSTNLNLEGTLSGRTAGRLMPGGRLELRGTALFTGGTARVRGGGGELSANIREVSLNFDWRNEALSGELILQLAQSGAGRGTFRLPIPARLPVTPNPKGPVQGSFVAKVQEKGILSSLAPNLIQESHGLLDADLTAGGTWENPRVQGYLRLTNAGGYLPNAGIRVSDVTLTARLENDLIRIDTFSATSGPGRITGEATVRLSGTEVIGYRGTLKGERFQTVFLPELQLLTSPQLTFQGNLHSLSARGEILIPEMLISGPPVREAIGPSRDVILEGAPPAPAGRSTMALDVQVRVTLGDKVRVKTRGIDANLGGGMEIVMKSLDRITSRGEIRVVKGSYRAYGIDLDIVRGRIYYAGGPINQPTLDILALRKVEDVKAGVTVEGVMTAPIIKLYSEPSMPDVDILAYIVLGHPMGNSGEQISVMSQAAGALFSLGGSESLQEKIKERLGLSVLGFEQRTDTGTGTMGYKEIPVSPTGAATSKGVTTQSMLTVGKYITPKLYFSYGRSVVTGNSLFQLRYDIFRHWQIETQTGTESGADLYYKIEFN